MPCGGIVTVVASFRCACAPVRPAALRQRDQHRLCLLRVGSGAHRQHIAQKSGIQF